MGKITRWIENYGKLWNDIENYGMVRTLIGYGRNLANKVERLAIVTIAAILGGLWGLRLGKIWGRDWEMVAGGWGKME
jgi:uncharacterized protein (DUF697 family)